MIPSGEEDHSEKALSRNVKGEATDKAREFDFSRASDFSM